MFNLKSVHKRHDEHGFTLVELLVVVVVIGILIGIAIPVYANYKKGAADKLAMSDLRAAITTLEQCQSNGGGYPDQDFQITDTSRTPVCTSQTIATSEGTNMYYYRVPSATGAYLLAAWNEKGTNGRDPFEDTSKKVYCYASAVGGPVRSSVVQAILGTVNDPSPSCP